MKIIKKYFYLIAVFLGIIGFTFEITILKLFMMFSVLTLYQREQMYGDLSEYTKEQTVSALKKVFKYFFIMFFIIGLLLLILVALKSNIEKNLIYIYSLFFMSFFIFYKFLFGKIKIFTQMIDFFFSYIDKNFLLWSILISIFITKKNFYLYQELIVILIPIFTFFPPIVSLLDKEGQIQKKIIKYSIFLIINLLTIIVFEKISVPNFSFYVSYKNIIFIILSLIKLLCTSFIYFYILQITYLSGKLCTSTSIKENQI